MIRRALFAALAALAIGVGAAATATPRTIANPPPGAAVTAVRDLVNGLPQAVSGVHISPNTPASPKKHAVLTKSEAIRLARTSDRLNAWLDEHPIRRIDGRFDDKSGEWTISFVAKSGRNGPDRTEAEVLVTDTPAAVKEVRTGPQVAWMMARGYTGAFGRGINRPALWISLMALFLIPLVSWRRFFSLRTLDLAVLLSLSASLVWFNRGEIFTSVPLAYPPLIYLALRMVVIAYRRARPRAQPFMSSRSITAADNSPAGSGPQFGGWSPTWLLVTLLALALGIRYGLNAFDSNVIDVGYAGPIGADRISHGRTPYGTFPSDCGRCDTYGPLNYIAYVPFEWWFPWTGKWDDLPAAHGAAVAFDVIAILGLLVLGWLVSGPRLATAFGLAWAAFPFTSYSLETNSNDSLVAAMLIWGLVVARRPLGRGLMLGLAMSAKFAPAVLLVLWARHPFPRRAPKRGGMWFSLGLLLAAAMTGWVLALDGMDGIRAFWSRTIKYQFQRASPFSIWGQYPGLRPVQIALVSAIALAAVAVVIWPRQLDLVQFAAISAALMIGTQLTLTHWFYLYIPWFLPFVILALVPDWPARRRAVERLETPVPTAPERVPV